MAHQQINPWQWSIAFGFSQAIKVENPREVLVCSGQTAVNADGTPVEGDMVSQIRLALENLETVLSAAGFSLSDVVRLNFYTTDVDEFFAASETAFERMPDAALPAGTLLGVARLAYPELKIEIEATAVK